MQYDLCLHVDSADPAVLTLALNNAANYFKGLPGERFSLALVANGPAVRLFVNANAELRRKAEVLQAQGLRIALCNNALEGNGIDPAAIWPGCEVVPAGLVEIVRLQGQGYAYIKP